MTAKLDKPIKRELEIEGVLYTILLTPDVVKLTRKGHRKGIELPWRDLVNGDAALAAALNASVANID